jgi:hypothetical protein|tara:strand:- start:1184 stop:1360 length:177 start_codon:yes stop_codon:yes gene_type:complete
MGERKVVDFDKVKGGHLHARKNVRLKKMRAAFKASREAVAPKKPRLKKRSTRRSKKSK